MFRPGVFVVQEIETTVSDYSITLPVILQEGSCTYLVCCRGDDAYWEGEDEGHATGEDEPPPWEVNLVIQHGAEDEGDRKRHCKE